MKQQSFLGYGQSSWLLIEAAIVLAVSWPNPAQLKAQVPSQSQADAPVQREMPGSPLKPGTRFSDLAHHMAEEPAINRMVAQGVMRPVSPTKFAPDMPETLGEFAVSVQHMFDLPQPPKPINFSDVPPSSPIHAAVQAMVPYMGRHILCFGCALATNFLPNQPVSRAISAVTLVRILMAQKKISLLTMMEADEVLRNVEEAKTLPPPSRPYFATAIRSGILALSPEHKIEPAREHSRANMAVLLDHVQKKFNVPRVRPVP